MGTVSQIVDGGRNIMKKFHEELVPSLRLSVERFFQVVITAVIPKRLSNLFDRGSKTDAMQNVSSRLIEGGDHVCGFVSGLLFISLRHGLRLLSENGP
jgi:hypothetical protein